MEDQLTKIRRSSIYLMNKTVRMLGNVLQNVSQEQAATLRDGDDGWTVLEVVCHLRDYSNIFYERAQMMLNDEYPDLPAYDHEALAVERAYNQQDLREVYADMNRQRKQIVRFFLKLTDAQWQCAGTHPEKGHFTMTDAALQFGTHDADHLEQITRILAQIKDYA